MRWVLKSTVVWPDGIRTLKAGTEWWARWGQVIEATVQSPWSSCSPHSVRCVPYLKWGRLRKLASSHIQQPGHLNDCSQPYRVTEWWIHLDEEDISEKCLRVCPSLSSLLLTERCSAQSFTSCGALPETQRVCFWLRAPQPSRRSTVP